MPKRTAVTLIGLTLLAAIAVSWFWFGLRGYQHEHAKEREQAATYQTTNATQQIEATCAPVSRSRTTHCVASVPIPDGSNPYAEHDLRAQQDMAEWAFAMFIATIAGVVVTIIGLIYVVRAYRLNAIATDHARKAAEAATEQAETAGKALAAERRPWVSVDDVRLVGFAFEPINRAINITTIIVLRNAGQSPALDVWISVGATGDADPNEPQRRQDKMRAEVKQRPKITHLAQTIFPNSPPRPSEYGVSISREELGQLFERWRKTFPEGHASRDGRVFIIPSLYGVVGYRSPYDDLVHTTCFIITYSRVGGKALSIDQHDPGNALVGPGDLEGRIWFGGWDAD